MPYKTKPIQIWQLGGNEMNEIDFKKLESYKGKPYVYLVPTYQEYKSILDWHVSTNPIENYNELASEELFNKYFNKEDNGVYVNLTYIDLEYKNRGWASFTIAHKGNIFWKKAQFKFTELPYIKEDKQTPSSAEWVLTGGKDYTAKEMFEALGYDYLNPSGIEKKQIHIRGDYCAIFFSLTHKEYWHTPMSSITIEEHKAIHQQMKELNWL